MAVAICYAKKNLLTKDDKIGYNKLANKSVKKKFKEGGEKG